MTLDTYTALIFVAGALAGAGAVLDVLAGADVIWLYRYIRRRQPVRARRGLDASDQDRTA